MTLYELNTMSTLSHLFLVSLAAEHSSFYHSRHGIPLFDLDCLLVRAFDGHLLRFSAVRGHILVNHLPRDLVNNIRIIWNEKQKRNYHGASSSFWESPHLFYHHVAVLIHVLLLGDSLRGDVWQVVRLERQKIINSPTAKKKMQTQYVDQHVAVDWGNRVCFNRAVCVQLCCSAAISLFHWRCIGILSLPEW